MTKKKDPKVPATSAKRGTDDPGRALVRAGAAVTRFPSIDPAKIDRDGDVVRVRDADYLTRDCVVAAEEVYFVRDAKTRSDGPWLGEADKVTWRDPATGYDCIVLRHADDGTLGGFVGIPHGHPLWGFGAKAIPSGLGIDVHGGVTYARICEEERVPAPVPRARLAAEARRICHVPRGRPSSGHVGAEDDGAWWFGFRCDHVHDVIPAPRDRGRRRSLEAEVGAIYRDDAYVISEVRALAAQLRSIADGEEVVPRSDPPPAAALDPDRES